MTVEKFLDKWYDKEIEDWCGETSPEYRNFQMNYRSVLKDISKNIGMELYSFNKNHYDFSAVLRSNVTNQYYYISISDVRTWKNEWADKVLYRTMEHEKDWTGGSNHYSTLEKLAINLLNLDLQLSQKIEKENTRQIANQAEMSNKIDDLDLNYA